MKHLLLALILLSPVLSFAQTPQLPEGSDAQKRYDANRLRVVQTYPNAHLTSKKSYHWTALQGERVLTEDEFFAIAGRPDLALEGRRQTERRYMVQDAAPTLVGLGAGTVFAGLIVANDNDGQDGSKGTGQAISATGVLMVITGIWKLIDNDVLPGNSFQTAVLAANEFNDRLMMALLLESQQETSPSSGSELPESDAAPTPVKDTE